MYEIWLGYEGDALIATCPTPRDVLAALDRIADETAEQLEANGEGAQAFALHLVVREASTGEVAATFCSYG
jgi:hypothetical protein